MSKATKSFTTVNVTNILKSDFVQEYTDPVDPLEKVEVNIPAGETVNLPSLVGDIVASDIAGAYLASKGLAHYWPDLQKALEEIAGKKAKPATKAKATPAPVVEDEGEEEGTEEEGSEEGSEDEGAEGTSQETPAPKAKTKR